MSVNPSPEQYEQDNNFVDVDLVALESISNLSTFFSKSAPRLFHLSN